MKNQNARHVRKTLQIQKALLYLNVLIATKQK